jgi:hypothetical protein
MIEKGKDGRFLSGKYQSTLVRYNRPHFLVFSNQAPPSGCLSEDRLVVTDLRSGEFTAQVDIMRDINDKTTLRGDDVDDAESAAGAAGGLSEPLGSVMTTTGFANTGNATFNLDGTTEAVHGGGQPQQQRGDWAQHDSPHLTTMLHRGPAKRRRRPLSIISTDDEDAVDYEDL